MFDDPLEWLAWVTAWTLSAYGNFQKRVNKPFNSLLHETCDIIGPDWWAMTEQVSHHPPITAICFEAAYAKLIANSDMGLSFNGKGIDVVLRQNPIIYLMNQDKGFTEKYSYEFGRISAVNLIWGQMMFTHSGTVHVYQEESGAYAKCKINHC